MKYWFKKTFAAVMVVAMLLVSSCSPIVTADLNANKEEYVVNCVYGDGIDNKTFTVKAGETLALEAPSREGYEFVGWCKDSECKYFYDLSEGISSDVTLYAKWDIDYKYLLANVSDKVSESCVKVISSTSFGVSSQGSGVIYKIEGKYAYVLTNSHVVTTSNGTLKKSHTVYDVYGNEYVGTVIKNDAKYDLAVVRFAMKSSVQLNQSEILNRFPLENERVITVSAPNGQYNTVCLGDVSWYSKLDNENVTGDSSQVNFEVLWIDGSADHGSSGGAVYDKYLKVIGIIYATVNLADTHETFVLAIPSSKIVEFLADVTYTDSGN